MKIYLAGLVPEQIQSAFPRIKPYTGRQLFSWLHKPEFDFSAMTDLSLEFRGQLAEQAVAVSARIIAEQKGADGSCKYKLRLSDNSAVETVLLSDREGRKTACLSTQVGCAMGCAFCATARMGFVRNLLVHEIVEQYLLLKAQAGDISHIVFMGMGEPLLNLERLRSAINVLHHPGGSGISLRRMTLSTCGLPKGIYDLAEHGPPIRLALSLISADPALRKRLMPAAGNTPLPELQRALQAFQQATGKRITIEIIILPGANDRPRDFDLLCEFVRPLHTVINVIPWNRVPDMPWEEPDEKQIGKFIDQLKNRGLHVTQRYSKGRNINAACGQLAVMPTDPV
jgi:23S rRNA (adenine2503-C2)-methyltransferase